MNEKLKEQITARKLRKILKLRLKVNLNYRAISASCMVSHATAMACLKPFEKSNITWEQIEFLEDAQLEKLLEKDNFSKDSNPDNLSAPISNRLLSGNSSEKTEASTQKQKFNAEELKHLLSPYLSGGYKKDEIVLESVEIEKNIIAGKLSVKDYFMPSDGRFHFSGLQAVLWVSQLGIVYSCWDNNLKTKPGEVYQTDIELNFYKPVTQTKDISIILKVLKKSPFLSDRIFYKLAFDIDNGSFAGSGGFIFPLKKR